MNLYLLIVGVVVVALVVFLAYKPKTITNEQLKVKADTQSQQENPYKELRNMALGVTPNQLGLQISDDQTKVFGLVIDWDLGDGIATVAAYETGDASIYLSSGGGVIGGGQHDNVRESVAPYVKKGQDYLDKTTKTNTTPLPDKNCVRFYLLTNKGIFYAQETMKNIEDQTSEWFHLFEEANKVMTELRLTSEKK